MSKTSRGLIRELSRRGSRSDRSPPVARKTASLKPSTRLVEPAACERCGAVFVRKTWRRDHRVTDGLLARATWTRCPACAQAGSGAYFGRVLIRGTYAAAHETEIRGRIRNVEARARFTQPERRVVSSDRERDVLEILTTSQKLAHRIARELKKAFRGRTTYTWSDDGTLLAVWERNVSRR
jgi:NMD protein affecting ribosome stability and mRNA decay